MKEYCDFHIHSKLSMDGSSTIMEQVCACAEKNVRWVCFTEHIDIATREGDYLVDFEEYRRQIAQAREAFPGMHIGMGLELGDTTESRERVEALGRSIPLDYKLLSRHQVGGIDPYDAEDFFAAHPGRERAAQDYVDALLRSVIGFSDYDALAHLGYVFKFAQEQGFAPLQHRDAPDRMDEILRYLIENGKALEINTSRWDRFGDGMPGRDILQRYRELGGELITLGSDAHSMEGIAQGFAGAVEQLKELGFRYLTAFEQRKPIMLEL